jgi:medium-chain acyl-[acyl-carrier-protein] hydrolase
MSEQVEVCAVQLPGHGTRIREPAFQDFELLLKRLAEALVQEMDRPYALFGHSMGALLVFELARRSRAGWDREPLHVFVSGHNSPRLPEELDGVSQLSDPELIDKLRELNCTPEEALAEDELMKLMLPVIRADFAVCESYVYREGEPLRCPLTAMGGLRDPRTDQEGLEAWRELTEGPFLLRQFPGDHFFIATQGPAVVPLISQDLVKALEDRR